ncbi:hypothetical protein LOTGIDRAFT_221393 [Lottia gigantea]|uniref:Carbohydrate kinase PfkB domain-containing protein n=1 Tax=Lottia gigantea TaxID=225164 RepID=V3ZS63_LOTGI|nr:hypothetical protein LOTGIDRAFT_221393 [Lottia gigantea]ESO85355.1 hypothetical protein LOTGIDRAFT_221393 [Lottia gigantea]
MRNLVQTLCSRRLQLVSATRQPSWLPLHSRVLHQKHKLSTSTTRYFNLNKIEQIRNGTLSVSEEVRQALHEHGPVVALESTIITHGMPYPHNIKTGLEVEDIIRKNGCIPATIGVLDGRVHVGLDKTQLEQLGSKGKDLVKISRRDFPYVLAKKLSGGTTVSGTMLASHLVGIQIFATGGIGGVHRGAEQTMDISADLTELGRTPVTVVSAGVKSILDIEKTLEYLETQGVCVATFGQDKDFPAFFVPSSGLKAPYNIRDEIEAAEMIYSKYYGQNKMKLDSGILIGVPLPDSYNEYGQQIETAIDTALHEVSLKKIQGKEVTPYILQRVHELTGGESLHSNIALIKNNADIGSKIAWQLTKLQNSTRVPGNHGNNRNGPYIQTKKTKTKKKRPIVIGGSVVDFNARLKSEELQGNGSTNPGIIHQSFGGVGRNIADCLARLGADPLFISTIGEDCHTENFLAHCGHLDLRGIRRQPNCSTATYCGVLGPSGQLQLGIGDMDVHQLVTNQMIYEYEEDIKESSIVIVDGNISPVAIETACQISTVYNVPVLFEPTDILKASRPFLTSAHKQLTYTSPNINELQIMSTGFTNKPLSSQDLHSNEFHNNDDVIAFCMPHCLRLVEKIPVVIVTLGQYGVLLCKKMQNNTTKTTISFQVEGKLEAKHYPAYNVAPEEIVSVSGAGDCFISAFVNGVIHGHHHDDCVKLGLFAAELSLRSSEAVPQTIHPEDFSLSKMDSVLATRSIQVA